MKEWEKLFKVIHVPYGKAGFYLVDMRTGLSQNYLYKSRESAEKGALRQYTTKMEALEKAIWAEEYREA